MGRIRRELALTSEGLALTDQRLADRDECPVGVRGTDTGGDEQRDRTTHDEHQHEDPEGPLLGRPVADDLEEELSTAEGDGIGQDTDRRFRRVLGRRAPADRDGVLADIALPRLACRDDRLEDRQAGRDPRAASDRIPLRVDDHRERA